MKLLLDENLPHELRHFIPGHEVFTVAYMGWRGRKNGELLTLAASDGFDALLTMDSGIPFQHQPGSIPISVVILSAVSNAMDDLRPLIPQLLQQLTLIRPQTVTHVG